MTPDFQLTEDARGHLTLRRPDLPDAEKVSLRRSFPWSRPGQFISVRSSESKELVLIEDVETLPESQRALVTGWLARHSFIPRIEEVFSIDLDYGYQQWRVRTDRGNAEFRVQEREDIRFLHDGRFSIKDADGNVYELANLERLKPATRRVLETLI